MATQTLQQMSISKLFVGKNNVRRAVGDITELTMSIEEEGVIEPLIVRPLGNRFEVIVGSRRLAASKAVGLKQVPVIVRKMTDDEALVASLTENIQRNSLEPVDLGRAVKALKDRYDYPEKKIATALGLSQQTVSNFINDYQLLVRLEKSGTRVTYHPKPEEREKGEAVPYTHTVMVSRAFRSPDVQKAFKDVPEKEVEEKEQELTEAIAPLNEFRAQKVIDQFKMHPDAPVEKSVERGLAQESGVSVTAYFTPRIAKGLEKAADERGMEMEEVIVIAVEEWLKQVGYIGR